MRAGVAARASAAAADDGRRVVYVGDRFVTRAQHHDSMIGDRTVAPASSSALSAPLQAGSTIVSHSGGEIIVGESET